MKKIVFALLSTSLLSGLSHAQTRTEIASDNAGNYTTTMWTNNSNGGSGFANWSFGNYTAADDTVTIANSSVNAGNINSPGAGGGAFRIASNNGGSVEVIRSFGGSRTLRAGDIFSFDMTLNFRNGNKGFDLRNGGDGVFNFDVRNNEYHFGVVNLSDTTGQNWSYVDDGVYHLEFEFITETSMKAKIQRTTSGGTDTYEIPNVALANPVDNFKFYVSGTDDDNPENSLYFNNLKLSEVPEPHFYGLMAGVLALLFAGIHRRRRG